MATLWWLLGIVTLLLVCFAALFSLLFGFPGTFVILAAALIYAWATGFAAITWSTLGWLTGLALVGEAVELVAAAGGAGERPSRRVAIAAIAGGFIGGIIGLPILFGIGALLGALAGAFVGAALAAASEGDSVDRSFRAGVAALRGRLLGFILKTSLAVVMVVLVLAAAL
jgi:uncharacterized protein YqgC (DUF456 family)